MDISRAALTVAVVLVPSCLVLCLTLPGCEYPTNVAICSQDKLREDVWAEWELESLVMKLRAFSNEEEWSRLHSREGTARFLRAMAHFARQHPDTRAALRAKLLIGMRLYSGSPCPREYIPKSLNVLRDIVRNYGQFPESDIAKIYLSNAEEPLEDFSVVAGSLTPRQKQQAQKELDCRVSALPAAKVLDERYRRMSQEWVSRGWMKPAEVRQDGHWVSIQTTIFSILCSLDRGAEAREVFAQVLSSNPSEATVHNMKLELQALEWRVSHPDTASTGSN